METLKAVSVTKCHDTGKGQCCWLSVPQPCRGSLPEKCEVVVTHGNGVDRPRPTQYGWESKL